MIAATIPPTTSRDTTTPMIRIMFPVIIYRPEKRYTKYYIMQYNTIHYRYIRPCKANYIVVWTGC